MPRAFDPGPPRAWEDLFAAAPLDHFVNHPRGRFRHEFGPVFYRGRLNGTARVLLVAQDPATNELLAHRTLVGSAGQRVQGFLRKLGIERSYLMLNTFLFPVHGQFDAELRRISLEPPILMARNAWFDRAAATNRLEVVIAAGRAAAHAVDHWPGHDAFEVVEIQHPSARDEAALAKSWNRGLRRARTLVTPDRGAAIDPAEYGTAISPGEIEPIPRRDLPFGVPHWMGDGEHAERDGPTRLLWTAP
jgi:uracil-DNA glycosylase